MTENEWINCAELTPMLIHLRGEVGPEEREATTRHRSISSHGDLFCGDGSRVKAGRLSRFALECCKKWWELPLDDASSGVVAAYERFLRGEGLWSEFMEVVAELFEAARTGAKPLLHSHSLGWSLTPLGMSSLTQTLAWITASYHNRERIDEVRRTASDDDLFAWGFFGYEFPEFHATAETIFRPLPGLLREVVGNPFRPVFIEPAWRTTNVLALAKAIDGQRAFDRMPILADALEEVGCNDLDILGHCRGPGAHVVGCWLIDLILGRE